MASPAQPLLLLTEPVQDSSCKPWRRLPAAKRRLSPPQAAVLALLVALMSFPAACLLHGLQQGAQTAVALQPHVAPGDSWLLMVGGSDTVDGAAPPQTTPTATPQLGTPKVAFLFLVTGGIPLEAVWERFFSGASKELYSVYVHRDPRSEYNTSEETSSAFYKGRTISDCRPVNRWTESSVEAERRLIAAALADPSSEHFALVSESDIPLWNFSYTYDYLHSCRGCSFLDRDNQTRPGLVKASQWFVLSREHAQLFVDERLDPLQVGYIEEHHPHEDFEDFYLPSLIYGRDPDHVVRRSLMFVDWREPGADGHPKTYTPSDVSSSLVHSLQNVTATPRCSFDITSEPEPCELKSGETVPCFLFARKFAPDTAAALLEALPGAG